MGVICVWHSEWLVKDFSSQRESYPLERLPCKAGSLMWRQPLPAPQNELGEGKWISGQQGPQREKLGVVYLTCWLDFLSCEPSHRSLTLSLSPPPGLPTTCNCCLSLPQTGTIFAAWKPEVSWRKTYLIRDKDKAIRTPRAAFRWPRHCWHLEADHSCGGAALCIVGCLAALLVSTHWMPAATLQAVAIINVSRHCLMCPGEQIAPTENLCPRPMSNQVWGGFSASGQFEECYLLSLFIFYSLISEEKGILSNPLHTPHHWRDLKAAPNRGLLIGLWSVYQTAAGVTQ